MHLFLRFFTIFFGYFLARRDLFPPAASRGASQVTMNISLPALVFANIVPAFTPQNIASIGPLFLIAFVYMIIGFSAGGADPRGVLCAAELLAGHRCSIGDE